MNLNHLKRPDWALACATVAVSDPMVADAEMDYIVKYDRLCLLSFVLFSGSHSPPARSSLSSPVHFSHFDLSQKAAEETFKITLCCKESDWWPPGAAAYTGTEKCL